MLISAHNDTIWTSGKPKIAGVSVTVLEGEEHQRTAQMTEQVCETGKIISDHIILKPRVVTLQFEESNVPVTNSSPADAVTQVFNIMETIWSARTPITLQTLHFTYANMVCTSLSGIHKAPFRLRLKFTATFTQINQVVTGFSSIPASEMGNVAQMKEYTAGIRGVPQTPDYNGATPLIDWLNAVTVSTQTFSTKENSMVTASEKATNP